MSIQKKHVPGCQCCLLPCEQFFDTFSTLDAGVWTQEAGTWTQSGSEVYSLDANAILLLTDSGEWSYNWRIEIDVTFIGNNKYKVFWSWVDSSNHWYLEFSTTSRIKIVEVSGGTPTTHVDISDAAAGSHDLVQVCYENGYITVQSTGGTAMIPSEWIHIEATPPQGKVGYGTVNTSPDKAGSCALQDFTYDRNPRGTQVCAQCWNGRCCGGYGLPDTVTLTVAGLTSPYDVWNGVYIVPASLVTVSVGGACRWRLGDALTALSGDTPTTNLIEIARDAVAPEIAVDLLYIKADATRINYTGTATLSGSSWTISPCHDQWMTPIELTRHVNFVNQGVDGEAESMVGDF